MKNIQVYDVEAKQLEKIVDDNDTNIAEVVQAIMEDEELVEKMKWNNGWR